VEAARAALDRARTAASLRDAAQRWTETHERLLTQAAAVVGPLEPGTPLPAALGAMEERMAAELETLRRHQAALQARLEAAEASLAALHEAGASCPVCLRELDDQSRARAEELHRTSLEAVRADLARLEGPSPTIALDAVRTLAREAASLGPPPAAPGVPEREAPPQEAEALALLEAAAAGLREAELQQQAAVARVERIRADLEAADALTEQYRAEALLVAGKAALDQTVTTVLGRQLEPLAAEVNRRWEAVFPDRPNLHVNPDGQLSRVIDGAALEFGAFSAGEQMVAKLMMRLTTLLATTTVPFCWIDEPLEHLDPMSRQLVASTLAHLSAAGGLEQIFVTTYEEPLARRLAELQPGRVRVQYLRTEPAR
jgi:DNA repair exonuclease SbcCD ATPase subunit